MGDRRLLSPSFLGALGVEERAAFAVDRDLESRLSRMVSSARAAWPGVQVADEVFVTYVAERVYPEELNLSGMKLDDLYVACGAARGQADALQAIEEQCFPDLRAAVARTRLPASDVDEVLQALRRKLFAGDEAEPARIRDYTGRGELRGWLRVSAVRAALKVIRRAQREAPTPSDERIFVERASAGDPELSFVKAAYRERFRAAFQEALDSLTDRDKNLLRQNLVDDLSIDELGALYGVHRATAARWLSSAREALLERTRKAFMRDAKLSVDECASALRLVQSQLDETIRRRLERAG